MHFLTAGAANGERLLFIALGESEAQIRKNAETIGLDLEGITFLNLIPTLESFTKVETYNLFPPAELELEPTTRWRRGWKLETAIEGGKTMYPRNLAKTGARSQLERYVWALAAVWTVVVATSLTWNMTRVRLNTLEMARIQARAAYEKDIIYRRWNTGFGGVYVTVSDRTQPNPYLSHIPERDVTTPSGRLLTLMNPAYMTRQVYELGTEEYGVYGHITSLSPIRPQNAPDLWETEALRAFERGETEVSSAEEMEGQKFLRLMRPLFTEQGCLLCHASQGYKEGDLRGGISVAIPMDSLWAMARSRLSELALSHGLVWLIGLGMIVLGWERLARSVADRVDLERQAVERARAEKALRKSERRYWDLYENAPNACFSVGVDGIVRACNGQAGELLGSPAEQLIGRPVIELYADTPHGKGKAPGVLERFRAGETVTDEPLQMQRADGRPVWVSLTVNAVRDEEGQVVASRSMAVNISERMRVERALRVLSECNQALVRATDEACLLEDVCRILVEDGGYRLAWVGFAGEDEARSVRPMAQAGYENGYLSTIHVTWADDEWGRGPTGRAIRSGEPAVARNLLTDPDYAPWRAEAVERGYASSIALPLISESRTFGALNIYAAEPDAFDEEEVRLLGELAGDLAYGLTALRTRTAREQAEEALRKSEERYRRLVENSPAGIVIHSQGKVVFANPAIAKLVGAAGPQELLGREILDFVHPDYRETVLERARSVQEGDRAIPTLEEKFLRLDGSAVDVEVTGVPFVYQSQPGVQVIVTDITERKQAAEEIKQRNRGLSTLLEVSQALATTLDLDTVLQTSIKGAVDLMELGSGAIYLLEGETLYLGATTPPLPPQFSEELRRAPLADHPHIRQAITTGRPVILPDTATANLTPAERAVSEMRGLRSIVYAPLLAAEQAVGVWILASIGESRAFSEAEIDMSRTLSTPVALAVENARLYTSVQRHAAKLEQRVAARTADLKELVDLMAGREVRMAELKKVIRQLRSQLVEAGQEPAADDPLADYMEG